MSGVAVVWYLLKTNSNVIAVVPAARVSSGNPVPLNAALPSIAVFQISSIPNNFIHTNAANKMHSDRVQVSVKCKWPQTSDTATGFPGAKSLLQLVLAACPNQRGTVNGIVVDSIVPDIEQIAEADTIDGIQEGSRDFLVKWIGA